MWLRSGVNIAQSWSIRRSVRLTRVRLSLALVLSPSISAFPLQTDSLHSYERLKSANMPPTCPTGTATYLFSLMGSAHGVWSILSSREQRRRVAFLT